jgi:hypothetical protein
MNPYYTLIVSGRARRLRTLAFSALAHYDLDVARLRLVTNDMNGIFRLDTHDRNKYILRVTAPEGAHRFDDVAAEMDWLAALARDTMLSVPRPVPARDGALVVERGLRGRNRLVHRRPCRLPGQFRAQRPKSRGEIRRGRVCRARGNAATAIDGPAGMTQSANPAHPRSFTSFSSRWQDRSYDQ